MVVVLALIDVWTAPGQGGTPDRPGYQPSSQGGPTSARETAYRENNIGVARLEQFRNQEAVAAFQRAIEVDSSLQLAHINLAIALFYAGDLKAAADTARVAATATLAAPQPPYILGLIARAENRPQDAIAHFQRVLQLDPVDLGARVNLGQVYLQMQRYNDAAGLFQAALESEPFNVTAAYNLAIALTRGGRSEDGQRAMERFRTLRESGYSTAFSNSYLEQGRYAEAVASTGAEPDLVDRSTPSIGFGREPLGVSVDGHDVRLGIADLRGDGHPDVTASSSSGLHVFRPDGAQLRDVTDALGLRGACPGAALGATAGDEDNDGRADLLILCAAGLRLYRQTAPGRFANASSAAGFAPAFKASVAALVDLDHDGDLDIVAESSSDRTGIVLRNNGNETFTDITSTTGIAARGPTTAIVPTDVDNRRDVDLLLAGDGPLRVFLNRRDGSFADRASDLGLAPASDITAAAVGDVNKDGLPDFFWGHKSAAGTFAMSDGHGRYSLTPAPASTGGAVAAAFIDYDNDGLLDLVALTDRGISLVRNVGSGWTDVSAQAVAREWRSAGSSAPPVSLVASDLDGDGDDDLVVADSSGRLFVGRNTAAAVHPGLAVRLTGRVSNRSGVGSKVELRAGSLFQKLETYATTPPVAPSDVLFGLGRHRPDAVRILWPSGVLQAEIVDNRASAPALSFTELDRKPSSCPFLYTWNGSRFEFVTDFLGGGEMGYWEAPGVRNVPDPNEYVRIDATQLQPRDGRLELRITNELEEVLYLDRVQLVAVAHPAGTAIYPNEGMRSTRSAPLVYVVADPQPPDQAVDDRGRDVRDRLARVDHRYADDFALEDVRGYAKPHTLTIDVGGGDATERDGRILLLLTGWTDYAFSSDNVAAAHAGLTLQSPALQVKDASGRWQTVIPELGLPVGRPQTVVADLTGKFLSADRHVRIVTNMRVYWDQILVDRSGRARAIALATLERQQGMDAAKPGPSAVRLVPSDARLRWRGFSAEIHDPAGGATSYAFERLSTVSPWKSMPGRYTREGDVLELVGDVDDQFVVSMPGDEIAVAFDARSLPPAAPGMTRSYLLFAQGYSKEMDINSASPDIVDPLPFHGMSRYPYDPAEGAEANARRRTYIERFNTRVVRRAIPTLDPSGR